jgi:hypothetical protein
MKFYFNPRRTMHILYTAKFLAPAEICTHTQQQWWHFRGVRAGAGGFVVFGMMCERKQTRGNLFSDETILFRAHKERIKVAARQKPDSLFLSLTWR